MSTLHVWTTTDFDGHYGVGTAAVVVAATEAEARELLDAELRQEGLEFNGRLKALTLDKPRAIVLNNGDY